MTSRRGSASTSPTPGRGGSHVASVLKGVALVERLAHERGDMSLAELADATGQPPASTYRLLATLEQAGWVTHDSDGYRLSLRMVEIAGGTLAGMSIRTAARPVLQRLTATVSETSYLALRADDHVVCLERIESDNMVRLMTWDVGQSLPLCRGGASLAILAHLPAAEATRISGRHADDLVGRLARIRRDGFALSAEEVTAGVASVGAAVFDADNDVVAAISVGGLAPAIRADVAGIGAAVSSAAAELSRLIGYAGPYPPAGVISPA